MGAPFLSLLARRLPELQGVLGLTDLLASLLEQHGARSALGLRSALQQLCKAALYGLHARSLSKLTSGCWLWEKTMGRGVGVAGFGKG